MPDTEPDEAPAGTRFILYRLTQPGIEQAQRRLHWSEQRRDAVTCGVMIALGLLAIAMAIFEARFGNGATITYTVLVMLSSGMTALMALAGTVGARGRFHRSSPVMCSIALEDYERERYGYGMETDPLDGVRTERVPEYLRLLRVVEDGNEYLYAVANRLHDLKEHGDTPDPEAVAKDDHVQ